MTTISYPAVGTGGFSESDFAEYFDGLDGIVNDYVGTALALTRINAGDIARYSPGKIRVGGYILEVTTAHDLTVSTSAATYYTWACYDPALNVAGGGGVASTAGPCTLGISSGLPSTTGSKQYVILDKIVRSASQTLTAAAVTSYRRWNGAAVEWSSAHPVEASESDYPRGSIRYDPSGNGKVLVRTINAAGTALEWREPGGSSAAIAFPAVSAFVAYDSPPQIIREGDWVTLRGTLKRSAGGNIDTGSPVTLGTLAVGYRPPAGISVRFICYGAGAQVATVYIDSTGTVRMSDPLGGLHVSMLSLDGIRFRLN